MLIALFATVGRADEYSPVPIAGVEMRCFDESTPVKWSFCMTRAPHSQNHDVIYHFHGRNGNATWWNDADYHTGKVHAKWLEMKKDPPTVISVSFGDLWLLSEATPGAESGLLNIYLNHVMYQVESRLEHPVKQRMLFGISMGGVNALLVSLKRPTHFSKVAVLCSTLPTLSHHAGWAELYRYYSRSGISLKHAAMKYYFSKKFFETQQVWELNNPLKLVQALNPADLPDFYISCGQQDAWDCMDGSEAIASAIKTVGGNVEWHARPGGHCDIDHASLASFLTN